MKKHLGIIFGGRSPEHEISVISARNIAKAVPKEKYNVHLLAISKSGNWYYLNQDEIPQELKMVADPDIQQFEPLEIAFKNGKGLFRTAISKKEISLDVCFPVMHGPYGEDGSIQGFLRILDCAFVGCGILGSAIGMDKEVMKRLLQNADIPTAPYVLIRKGSIPSYQDLITELGSPFFIKPANAGSSVGVHKIKTESDYHKKINDSLSFDHKVLAETFIQGREIECSVLGLNQNPKASRPGEIIVNHEFYSYEAKYIDAKGADLKIPAELSSAIEEKIREIAIKTFKTLECDGLSRIDFFVTASNEVFINEINTIPGFTQISMYPKMWGASGINYQDLIASLIGLAEEKYRRDSELKFSYDL